MRFTIVPMTPTHAREVLSWLYEGEYAVYNADSVESFLVPEYRYHAVLDEAGHLVGYCCFGEDARVPGGIYAEGPLDLGVGMRPDLTGRGLGRQLAETVLRFAQERYSPESFRVTVAVFNERARRLCESIGFLETGRFTNDDREFVQLERNSVASEREIEGQPST